METFLTVTGTIAPMLSPNIDTDVIMPKQFLKGIERTGLSQGVFFDQRFLESGEPNPDFALNRKVWKDAKFLAVGPNFGCGSSREHAVWGLKQLGIRALVGTTFAGIFHENCLRNGMLLVELEEQQMLEFGRLVSSETLGPITIDLAAQEIRLPLGDSLFFKINPLHKESLMLALDMVSNTLTRVELIRDFERQHLRDSPWLN
jgi:3-isopropylmalate/(R)-2-methylmalate dehydratase small subunit